MNYRGYKELECYNQARELRMFISDLVKKFPAHEKYLLIAKIISSSRSTTANIAEGYGRYTYRDTRNFLL
jgi:four helix bundle protein